MSALVYRNMIRYAWYAAKLITSKVFCNVIQDAFLLEVKTVNVNASSKYLLMFMALHIFAFVAFVTSTIWNPASLSPCSNAFHTILTMYKA
jgi:hypothetical protein